MEVLLMAYDERPKDDPKTDTDLETLAKGYVKKAGKEWIDGEMERIKDERFLKRKAVQAKDYILDKSKSYIQTNIVHYDADPVTEEKNKRKAEVGLGIGAVVSVASQIPVVTDIPLVGIGTGTVILGYGFLKSFHYLKDRHARKKRTKQLEEQTKIQDDTIDEVIRRSGKR